jgi:4-carboxymuconolactone decarboxylase
MAVSSATLRSISTPEELESRLGTLEFVDGLVPDPAPLQPARAVLRQVVAAERDRSPDLVSPSSHNGRKGTMAAPSSETPVLDLLASMTADSATASTLDAQTLMLVRIAALVAVDAPPVSYLLNLEAAADAGVDADQIRGVLAAIAPIVGTARVVSATGSIVGALAVEIEVAELEAEAEE